MKKLLLTTLVLGASAAAMAAPVATTFTGPAVELGVGAAKANVKNSDASNKTKTDVAIRGNYLADYGNNWIGGGEVAYHPNHRTMASGDGEVKQKYDASVSYIQGYRFANDLMAYGKVGYHRAKFDNDTGSGMSGGANGLGYGVGAKYAISPNVEAGLEWEQTRFKKHDEKLHNNSYMATVGYRF